MIMKCPPLPDSRWFVAFVIGLLTLAPVKRVKNQRKINIQQSFSIQVMTFPFRAQLWFLWTSTSIFELFPLSDRCLLFSLLSTSLFCRFLNWFNSRKQYCNILQYFFETSKRQPGAVFISTIFSTCHGSRTSSEVVVEREPPSEAFSESESGWKIGLGVQLTNLPVFL